MFTPAARAVNRRRGPGALCRLTGRAPEFYYDVGHPRGGLNTGAGGRGPPRPTAVR